MHTILFNINIIKKKNLNLIIDEEPYLDQCFRGASQDLGSVQLTPDNKVSWFVCWAF